jgi:hypothetical protein
VELQLQVVLTQQALVFAVDVWQCYLAAAVEALL